MAKHDGILMLSGSAVKDNGDVGDEYPAGLTAARSPPEHSPELAAALWSDC